MSVESRHSNYPTCWFEYAWQHIVGDIWSAICLAAAIAIIHHHFIWLHAVDEYAFVAVGNYYARQKPANSFAQICSVTVDKRIPSATVISIDDATHKTEYGEVSPLNRCRLRDHINRIYAADPSVLAIDFDISPAMWLRSPEKDQQSQPRQSTGISLKRQVQEQKNLIDQNRQKAEQCTKKSLKEQLAAACQVPCEAALYDSIRINAAKTVLAYPFSLSEYREEADQGFLREWVDGMINAKVTFGKAQLDVKFGLVRNAQPESESLSAKVHDHIYRHPDNADEPVKSRNSDEKSDLINPRKYLDGVIPLGISQLLQHKGCDRAIKDRPVFFGGSWGEGDTYLTPVGEMYGVEVHAASFLSFDDRFQERNFIGFLVDIAIGLVFGFASSICWKKYFSYRFSSDARRRQQAPLFIFLLLLLFCLVALPLAVIVSFFLLSAYSIWASPVPIAIGMAIESFVSTSVSEAVHEANHASAEIPHETRGLIESIKRSVTDIARLWRKMDGPPLDQRGRYHCAAIMLALRRLFWLAIVVWGIATLFMH